MLKPTHLRRRACSYGKGRVFCFSPHPEFTGGLHHLITLTIRWAAGKE